MTTEGLLRVNVIPMSGDLVLIKVDDDEDFQELDKDYEENFGQYLQELRIWSLEEVARERYV